MCERVEFFIEGHPRLDEPFHLKACGLDYVYLLSGVTIEEDPDYGRLVHVDNIEGLNRAIALHVIEKATPVTGPELRFLRKQMEMTQGDLARRLRISDQTVANYEKSVTTIPGAVDSLVRILYAASILPRDVALDLVQALAGSPQARPPEDALPKQHRKRIALGWREIARAA